MNHGTITSTPGEIPSGQADSHQAIVSRAVLVPTRFDCIYFLIRDQVVVYVGQTGNVLFRVEQHRDLGKDFDSYSFVRCNFEDRDRLESHYIAHLAPEMNGGIPSTGEWQSAATMARRAGTTPGAFKRWAKKAGASSVNGFYHIAAIEAFKSAA